MPRRYPLRVIKKRPPAAKTGGAPKNNANALKSGVYADLSRRNIDQRTKLARALHAVEADLVSALGGAEAITPQEKILVDRVVYKLARCTLAEAAHFSGESGADDHYIAWSNSLRLDLQLLGLERRAKDVLDLGEYVREQTQESQQGGAE